MTSRQTPERRPIAELATSRAGERFLVTGSGPSVAGFDLDDVGGAVTIGANTIGSLYYPDYYLMSDPNVYAACVDLITGAPSVRILASWLDGPADYVLPMTREDEYGFEKGRFFHGRNIGFVAVQLAWFLGASEIHLVGIDGYGGSDPYATPTPDWYVERSVALWRDRFREIHEACFALAAETLAAEQIRVVNYSPTSFLTHVPHIETIPSRRLVTAASGQ